MAGGLMILRMRQMTKAESFADTHQSQIAASLHLIFGADASATHGFAA